METRITMEVENAIHEIITSGAHEDPDGQPLREIIQAAIRNAVADATAFSRAYRRWTGKPPSEARRDERGERLERVVGVGPGGTQDNAGPVFCGQHHHAHDALAVHFKVIT